MTKIKVYRPICNSCSDNARIFFKGKWWCGWYAELGHANCKGYCKNDEKKQRNKD